MSEPQIEQGTQSAAGSGASVGAVVAHIAPGVPDWRVVERVTPWGERWGLVRQVRVWAVIDPEGDAVADCETHREAMQFMSGVRLGWARRGEVGR